MIIRQARCFRGEAALPGDKSISHRAAMISAIADGQTRIENFATSADCGATIDCLRQLGVEIRRDGAAVVVQGVGKTGLRFPGAPLDCGNSGTTMRLLSGILAGQSFDSVLTGDGSLQRRPMRRVIEPLSQMGATIESNEGCAPLNIRGRHPLRGIEYHSPVASAQIKSCVLLAGLNSDGETSVTEPVATRDHTERMLRWFGAAVTEERIGLQTKISVTGSVSLLARPLTVPADISAAAFLMVGAASLLGSDLLMKRVGLNPTRTAVTEILRDLGANIEVKGQREINNEPVGEIRVRGSLGAQSVNEISGDRVAQLIDELPILAVLGTRLEGGLTVREAGELRVKETDRIAAVVENLRRMQADVEEYNDGLRVRRSTLKGARIDSFGDHRIAMAFAIAGSLAEGETEIDGAECVDVSFPGFFDVLQNVVVYE